MLDEHITNLSTWYDVYNFDPIVRNYFGHAQDDLDFI